MSDEKKTIPVGVVNMLREAQLRLELAQERLNHLCTKVEAKFGVRVQGAQVLDDGTVIEVPPPEAPGP